jgi:uncharacterized phiE125 gp8 family phage protein
MAREPLLITAPVGFVLAPDEARAYIRVADRVEDEIVTRLIRGGTKKAEGYCRSKFLTQTWDHYFDVLDDDLKLAWANLAATDPITSVKYTDTDGVEQTVANTVYETGQDNGMEIVRLQYDQTWPTDVQVHKDVVVVRAVHGYGGRADVPEPIKNAIGIYVAHYFEHREGEESLPSAFYDELTEYRFAEVAIA